MADELFDIQGKVAAVTGGTGVLGGALARGLGRRGVSVAVLGRNQQRGQEIVDQIQQSDGKAAFIPVDVVDRDSCQRAAASVREQLGPVDFLINSAGGNVAQATATDQLSFFDLPPDALKTVMELNLSGTILPSQTFGQQMAEKKSGVIVNISSMAAVRPLTRVIGYAAAKAAVSNFTQWLSVYMCQHVGPQVRVNAIAPGFFLTEQNRFLLTSQETGELTARGQTIVEHTPMGRFGEPDELVGTLLWLVSPASQFVTGIVVPVDGGFSAFGGV